MSEPDKPEVDDMMTAASGTAPLEGTGSEDTAEKSLEKENGMKLGEEHEEGRCEKKGEDVEMEDAGDKKDVLEKESTDGKEAAEEKTVEEKMEEEENKEHKNDESIEEKGEEAEEKGDKGEKAEETEEKGMRKKRAKKLSSHEPGEKDEKKVKKGGRRAKEVLSTPIASSIDRPVRERKTVERLVETLRKEPSKALLIEKGQGTPLKDIPNVAYKLSKKRPGDIRSLHLLLFGRKGKATHYKSHIFQFSGFVWHENEEKQRAKVKEKLDKCVKDKLLDFCDVFDIPVSKAGLRKEDLVEKLLDFMVAPHATTDVILAEKQQSKKRKRMSRGRPSRTAAASGKHSRKKRTRGEITPKSEKGADDTEDEDGDEDEVENGGEEDSENGLPDEDESIKHSEDEENESEDDEEEEYSHKGRKGPKKKLKGRGSSAKASKKAATLEKATPAAAAAVAAAEAKSPTRTSAKRKADENKNANEKAFSKEKRKVVTPKKKILSLKPVTKEKKAIGKKVGRGKAKADRAADSGPTDEELRKTICEILKEVDFNTATFTDILKKLASHYNMDLTAKKASIKVMIQDELTKLADEAGDEDDNEDESEKEEDAEPADTKVET